MNKIHKILFPKTHKKLVFLEAENRLLNIENEELQKNKIVDYIPNLGLPISFHDVNDDGKPPFFLDTMNETERKTKVAELARIGRDEYFNKMIDYTINVLGNYAIQKASDENMKNGRVGIIAIKMFRSFFSEVVAEDMENKKVEEFDEHSVLPE